jgi:hypothetical protein
MRPRHIRGACALCFWSARFWGVKVVLARLVKVGPEAFFKPLAFVCSDFRFGHDLPLAADNLLVFLLGQLLIRIGDVHIRLSLGTGLQIGASIGAKGNLTATNVVLVVHIQDAAGAAVG